MKVKKEVFPDHWVHCEWKSIEKSKIPAVIQLSGANLKVNGSYLPPRAIYCEPAFDGTYIVWTDISVLGPELKRSTSTHIDCLVVDVGSASESTKHQTFREHLIHIEPSRHSQPPREAYAILIQNKILREHASTKPNKSARLPMSEAIEYLPNSSPSSIKRWNKELKLTDPKLSKIAMRAKRAKEKQLKQEKEEAKKLEEQMAALSQEASDNKPQQALDL